jgi:hypothetical protein
VRAGQAVRVSVRATYDTDNPFAVQSAPPSGAGGRVAPANRLSLSTPVLVLPAQPGSPGGEVVGQQPPMLNLLGVARAVAQAIGGSPKGSPLEAPVGEAEAMRGGGLGSTLGAPPTAKLVVRVVDGQGTERHRREQPLGHAAATTWEESGRAAWPSASRQTPSPPPWTGAWKYGWKTLILSPFGLTT